MKLSAVTVLFALFVFTVVNAELGEDCTVYDGSAGDCQYLSKCDILLQMVKGEKEPQISRQEAIAIVRKSSCGFVQSEPLVCCPPVISDSEASADKDLNEPMTAKKESPITPSSTFTSPSKPTTTTTTTTTTTEIKQPTTTPFSGFTNTPNVHVYLATEKSPATTKKTPSVTSTSVPLTKASTAAPFPPSTVKPSSTTAGTVATESSTGLLWKEKIKLLPQEKCGRVLSFKFFRGNGTDFDDFPWTTLIAYDTPTGKQHACGGALISKRYVLTAAHCLTGLNPAWKVSGVRFGEYDTSSAIDCLPDGPDNETFCVDKPVDYAVEEQIVHPRFMALDGNRQHDIALLRLAENVKFTYFVKPICLPFKLPVPQRYYTSGWGRNLVAKGTQVKYMSYLTLANQDECSKQYGPKGVHLTKYQVCAGTKPTEKSCIGDLGGPMMGVEEHDDLVMRVTVFGILSLTHATRETCEQGGSPGLYTNVTEYVPWIISQLRA